VRKFNDHNFENLNGLIVKAIDEYKTSITNTKLWMRFWNALELYKNGGTYKEVLQTYFGAKTDDKIKSHRKIANY
jgi:hypothetical protein